VLTILHERHEFDQYNSIVAFGKDYKDKKLLDFFEDKFL
jgi:hypothetical protein